MPRLRPHGQKGEHGTEVAGAHGHDVHVSREQGHVADMPRRGAWCTCALGLWALTRSAAVSSLAQVQCACVGLR